MPIGVSFVAESGLFTVVSLMMSTFGAAIVAGHQVAINYASTMFMLPLGVHSAATIRIGQAVGRGEPRMAMRTAWVAIAACAVIMTISAIVMLIGREVIVGRIYNPAPEVARVAFGLLLLAAIFQISDGLQIGAAGVLRGYKDTKIPMYLNFFSYWIIGFPMAWYLGIYRDFGPVSIWIGLVAGLTVCAVLLNSRVLMVSRRAIGGELAGQEPVQPLAANTQGGQ